MIIENKPILSIGDTQGFCERGVLINFYRLGKKLRFEINLPAVKKSGLTFRAQLIKLARRIN